MERESNASRGSNLAVLVDASREEDNGYLKSL